MKYANIKNNNRVGLQIELSNSPDVFIAFDDNIENIVITQFDNYIEVTGDLILYDYISEGITYNRKFTRAEFRDLNNKYLFDMEKILFYKTIFGKAMVSVKSGRYRLRKIKKIKYISSNYTIKTKGLLV